MRRRAIILSVVGLFLLVCFPSVSSADDLRKYGAGPLRVSEFRGRPDRSSPKMRRLDAFTYTEMRYTYRYRTRGRGRSWEARLTDFEVDAWFDRERSWNLRPNDKKLLSHEQGHFDLTQLWALKAKAAVHDELKQGTLRSTGTTEKLAVEALVGRIEQQMKGYQDAHVKSQLLYDRSTMHGRDAPAQAAFRDKLASQITSVEKAAD